MTERKSPLDGMQERSVFHGKSLKGAREYVVEQAIAAMKAGGLGYGVWTERGNWSMLVGYASSEGHAGAFLVPHEKYDGFAIMERLEERFGGKNRSGS